MCPSATYVSDTPATLCIVSQQKQYNSIGTGSSQTGESSVKKGKDDEEQKQKQ